MAFDRSKIQFEKIRYRDLKGLEKMFTTEFGTQGSTEIIKQRICCIRRFYYLLMPLSKISKRINNFFNIYIIRLEQTVIGFMQLSALTQTQLHLDYFALHQKYRSQGIGSLVLERLLVEVVDKQHCDIILEVKTDNPAQRLYERLGFSSEAQVFHYERCFDVVRDGKLSERSDGNLQPLTAADRALLPELYYASISTHIQQVVKPNVARFRPSMLAHHINCLKNHLMQARQQDFVAYQDGRLIALIELRSYRHAAVHVLSMMLHSDYECLRSSLLTEVIEMLANEYHAGKIVTTIYNDITCKQQVLESLKFTKQEAYHLMIRTAGEKPKRIKKFPLKHNLKFEMRKKRNQTHNGTCIDKKV